MITDAASAKEYNNRLVKSAETLAAKQLTALYKQVFSILSARTWYGYV